MSLGRGQSEISFSVGVTCKLIMWADRYSIGEHSRNVKVVRLSTWKLGNATLRDLCASLTLPLVCMWYNIFITYNLPDAAINIHRVP